MFSPRIHLAHFGPAQSTSAQVFFFCFFLLGIKLRLPSHIIHLELSKNDGTYVAVRLWRFLIIYHTWMGSSSPNPRKVPDQNPDLFQEGHFAGCPVDWKLPHPTSYHTYLDLETSSVPAGHGTSLWRFKACLSVCPRNVVSFPFLSFQGVSSF